MVVFELSQSDVAALKEALQSYTDIFEEGMEDMEGEELKNCQYELAHLKAIHTLMTRQRFQHLVEMCMARYGMVISPKALIRSSLMTLLMTWV